MAIIRACSYNCSIKTPEAPSGYSEILVTFAQGQQAIIDKKKSLNQLQTTATAVQVALTQAETKLLSAGKAYMQIRCYKSANNAPGSKLFEIPVFPALNDEVLP